MCGLCVWTVRCRGRGLQGKKERGGGGTGEGRRWYGRGEEVVRVRGAEVQERGGGSRERGGGNTGEGGREDKSI